MNDMKFVKYTIAIVIFGLVSIQIRYMLQTATLQVNNIFINLELINTDLKSEMLGGTKFHNPMASTETV